MALAAGDLNRRIAVFRPLQVDNGLATVDGAPAQLCERWAAIAPVSDGERFRAGETEATITMRFLVRYDSVARTITETDFLTFEGRTFGIAAVKEAVRWNGVALRPREAIEISATARSEGPV